MPTYSEIKFSPTKGRILHSTGYRTEEEANQARTELQLDGSCAICFFSQVCTGFRVKPTNWRRNEFKIEAYNSATVAEFNEKSPRCA